MSARTSAEILEFLQALTSEQLVEADGWMATHVPQRKVWGFKEIAAELGTSRRITNGYASRDFDPLPVEYGHLGIWAYVSALRAWMRRQNVPYAVRLAAWQQGRVGMQERMAPANAKNERLNKGKRATKPHTKTVQIKTSVVAAAQPRAMARAKAAVVASP